MTETPVEADGLRKALGRRVVSTPMLMRAVMLALLPGTVLATVLLGAGVLVNVLLATMGCLLAEALALRLRRRPVVATLRDGSAALAGWLLALTVTPTLPAWQLLLGCAIAIGLAKHVFGGLGHNPFNPAMVAYAVLLISFPATMTDWPQRTAQPLFAASTTASAPSDWDALSAQTPLVSWRQARRALESGRQEQTSFSRNATADTIDQAHATPDARPPGERQALIALAWLIGGLWLLWLRVIRWHIPVAMLATLAACETIALASGANAIGPLASLFAGGAMLGAFFIATDPVSAAASARGRLVYAGGIGLITFAIRQVGGWPDGVAFGVLLMNGAVPLIDRLSGKAVRR